MNFVFEWILVEETFNSECYNGGTFWENYAPWEALHNLRDLYKKVKYIKIKDARIRNNRMFQEDQGMKQPKH